MTDILIRVIAIWYIFGALAFQVMGHEIGITLFPENLEIIKTRANKADPYYMAAYAEVLRRGEYNVPINQEAALHFASLSASLKHPLGFFNLWAISKDDTLIPVFKDSLSNLAIKGSPRAQMALGLMHIHGKGVDKDYAKALLLFNTASRNGLFPADYAIGNCYKKGLGVNPDLERAAKYYLKAANGGLAPAKHHLGSLLFQVEKEDDTQEDIMKITEALKLYKSAALQGEKNAQYACGIAILKEWLKEEPGFTVYQLFFASSLQGHLDAKFRVAQCIDHGIGVIEDDNTAFQWYISAAKLGHIEAQYSVGEFFFNGYGSCDVDYVEAAKWWGIAAYYGHTVSQAKLGVCFEFGQGVELDLKKAIYWYNKAAHSEPGAQYRLGILNYTGKGVPQNKAKAVRWFEFAAAEGHVDAQYELGIRHYLGDGVPQNPQLAAVCFNAASIQGDRRATTLLGVMNCYGNGVPKQPSKGIKLLLESVKKGDIEAQAFLGIMLLDGEVIQKDFQKAYQYSLSAGTSGSSLGQYNLGRIYSRNDIVPQDIIISYAWYYLAASNGNESAQKEIKNLEVKLTNEQITHAREVAERLKSYRPDEKVSTSSPSYSSPIKGNGTGFFITANGYLLTNYHVVKDASKIEVLTPTGEAYDASIAKLDANNDLALLKITGNFHPIPLVSSRSVGLGSEVFTIGFPQVRLQGISPKFTKGTISSLTGIQDIPRDFQISVPVQPGNSGGALVETSSGNVVGVIVGILKGNSQNVNYAVKSTYVNALLETMPEVINMLRTPHSRSISRDFSQIVDEVKRATVMVLVY